MGKPRDTKKDIKKEADQIDKREEKGAAGKEKESIEPCRSDLYSLPFTNPLLEFQELILYQK